jgi:Na+/phosphate symporter
MVNRSILKVAELTEEYVAQLKRQHDEDIRITEDAQRGMDYYVLQFHLFSFCHKHLTCRWLYQMTQQHG